MEETLWRALYQRHAAVERLHEVVQKGRRGSPDEEAGKALDDWALVGTPEHIPENLAHDFDKIETELFKVVEQLRLVPGFGALEAHHRHQVAAEDDHEYNKTTSSKFEQTSKNNSENESNNAADTPNNVDIGAAEDRHLETNRRAFMENLMGMLATSFQATSRFEKDPNFCKRLNLTLKDSLGMSTDEVVQGYCNLDAACLARLLYFITVDSGLLDPPTVWESDATLRRAWDGSSLASDDPHSQPIPEIPLRFMACEPGSLRVRSWASKRMQLGAVASAVAAVLNTVAPSMLENKWVYRMLFESAANAMKLRSAKFSGGAFGNDDLMPVAKHVAWHCEQLRLAVVLQDESLRVLSLEAGQWKDCAKGLITHEFQRDVTCISWQPMSDDGLALGCSTGVCVWTNKMQQMVHLASDGFPVGTLAWSPNGRSLACGSALSGDILLWDVGSRTNVRLQRLRGTTDQLLWSPNGSFLYAGARGLGFRIWEAKSWGCELWSDFTHEVQDATWSGDGKTLLVSTGPSATQVRGEEDPAKVSVFAISFVLKPPKIGGELVPLELDVSSLIGPAAGLGLTPCVRVRSMAWNTSSDRLALSFHGSPAVALYAARWEPQLSFFFLGFIWGPPGALPREIAFQPSFAPGALLMVNYEHPDGCSAVRFVPLYFDKS